MQEASQSKLPLEALKVKIFEERDKSSGDNMEMIVRMLGGEQDRTIHPLFEQFMKYTSPQTGVFEGKDSDYRPYPLNKILFNKHYQDHGNFKDAKRTIEQKQIRFDPLVEQLQPLLSILYTYYSEKQLKANWLLKMENVKNVWRLTTTFHREIQPESAKLYKDLYRKEVEKPEEAEKLDWQLIDSFLDKHSTYVKDGIRSISLMDKHTMHRTLQPVIAEGISDFETEIRRSSLPLRQNQTLITLALKQPPYYTCLYFNQHNGHLPLYQSRLVRKWMIKQDDDLWPVFLKHRKAVELFVGKLLLHHEAKHPVRMRQDGCVFVRCSCNHYDNIWRYATAFVQKYPGEEFSWPLPCPLCKDGRASLADPVQPERKTEPKANSTDPQVKLNRRFAKLFPDKSEGQNHIFWWKLKEQSPTKMKVDEKISTKEKKQYRAETAHTGLVCWPEYMEGFQRDKN